jgi:signal transduction histidine kinase
VAAVAAGTDWVERVAHIRAWSRNGMRAPHKPLLLLYLLGRLQRSGANVPVSFTEAEVPVGRLLADFGPPAPTNAGYPFHHLTSDGLASGGRDAVLVITVERAQAGGEDLARAELAQAQRQLASDRERIGRDLHDLLIQRLFATGLALQSVAKLVELPEAARRINTAVDELDAVIGDIRATVFAFRQHGAPFPSLR